LRRFARFCGRIRERATHGTQGPKPIFVWPVIGATEVLP
jgi:hypothetical protein